MGDDEKTCESDDKTMVITTAASGRLSLFKEQKEKILSITSSALLTRLYAPLPKTEAPAGQERNPWGDTHYIN